MHHTAALHIAAYAVAIDAGCLVIVTNRRVERLVVDTLEGVHEWRWLWQAALTMAALFTIGDVVDLATDHLSWRLIWNIALPFVWVNGAINIRRRQAEVRGSGKADTGHATPDRL